jgi:hypothetical protein
MYFILSILNRYFKKLNRKITEWLICLPPPSAISHLLPAIAFCLLPSAYCHLPAAPSPRLRVTPSRYLSRDAVTFSTKFR